MTVSCFGLKCKSQVAFQQEHYNEKRLHISDWRLNWGCVEAFCVCLLYTEGWQLELWHSVFILYIQNTGILCLCTAYRTLAFYVRYMQSIVILCLSTAYRTLTLCVYVMHREHWHFMCIYCIQNFGILCVSTVYRTLTFYAYLLYTEHWHFVFIYCIQKIGILCLSAAYRRL